MTSSCSHQRWVNRFRLLRRGKQTCLCAVWGSHCSGFHSVYYLVSFIQSWLPLHFWKRNSSSFWQSSTAKCTRSQGVNTDQWNGLIVPQSWWEWGSRQPTMFNNSCIFIWFQWSIFWNVAGTLGYWFDIFHQKHWHSYILNYIRLLLICLSLKTISPVTFNNFTRFPEVVKMKVLSIAAHLFVRYFCFAVLCCWLLGLPDGQCAACLALRKHDWINSSLAYF